MNGPRWTRRRLIASLSACYGRNTDGHLDVAAVAQEFGVTRRTVYRWIAGPSGRTTARIPALRLRQLQLPPVDIERREQQTVDTARQILSGLDLPRGRGIQQRWVDQRWLELHMVAVVDLGSSRHNGLQLRQAIATRGTPRSLQEIRRRGTITDFTTVPTKFHATVLIAEVLDRVGPWRLYPGPTLVPHGRTHVWASDARKIDLAASANTFLVG